MKFVTQNMKIQLIINIQVKKFYKKNKFDIRNHEIPAAGNIFNIYST